MRLTAIVLLSILTFAGTTTAGENAARFTGTFSGTGRACSGSFHAGKKTIEWKTPFSVCRTKRYEILESISHEGKYQRIVYRLDDRESACRYEVIELEQAKGSQWSWNVIGYQSLEAFQNRNDPQWRDSPLPERWTLACTMTRTD